MERRRTDPAQSPPGPKRDPARRPIGPKRDPSAKPPGPKRDPKLRAPAQRRDPSAQPQDRTETPRESIYRTASATARASDRSGAATLTFPSKATHQQTRAYNAALVLRALYDFGPISRAEVARLSGLTRTTVGDVVGALIDEGLAREVGRGPSTGGKAPILLELIDGARHVIGLDLGEF